ncbi:MAG: aminoglycoside phosphotransferase [Spirochaetes bacterium RBG_13_51_14]|nr:MAG: aminoglycoside phosphotransferase [Spirochaetes bacterium RBG_13_51_14]
MATIDEPVAVREGDELDVATIGEFLKDAIPGTMGAIRIKQFPNGYSNLTYLIQAGDREMILRRPPFGKKPKSGHDMSREYRILKALKPIFRYCPEPLVYSEDPAIMGCPFYVMERIHGLIIRKQLPLGMHLTKDGARKLSENFITVLCELHSIDYKKVGLENFGRPEGYVKRQVNGWIGRYRDARTPDVSDYEDIMGWLMEKMPGESGTPCVIHNDYKFDNVVLDSENPLEIIGVLDWEMATIGDPLMDFGNSLAYWVEWDDARPLGDIAMMATNIEGMITRVEQIALYSKITGRVIDNFDFYYCFGLFRLAAIWQQLYYRYYHGQTRDERFQWFREGNAILETVLRHLTRISDI